VAVLVAAGAGIALDRIWPTAAPVWWITAVVALIAWMAAHRVRHDPIATACLAVAVAATGAAWHHARWNLFAADEIARYARDERYPVCVRAVAVGNPRRMPAAQASPLTALPHGDRTRLLVDVTELRAHGGWRPASGRVWLIVEGHVLNVGAGDRIELLALLGLPHEPLNPGEFDYVRHARADRQLCRMWATGPECVTTIAPAGLGGIQRALEDLRTAGDRQLQRYVARRYAPLASALMLGSREQIDHEQADAYFRTGMVHVLSISGLHVGMLALALFMVLRLGLMRRSTALVGVGALTLGYALVIQAEPPAVRATIVVLLACASMYAGRQVLGYNTLAAAALLVLALNPADLFRAGPQLSFLCAMILAWYNEHGRRTRPDDAYDRIIAPTWRDWLAHLARGIGRTAFDATALSVCIWLVALPLVMNQFHIVSPVALVLTTVLAPFIMIALVAGFGVLVTGWLLPPLASLLGAMCGASLWVIEGAIDLGSHVPAGHWWTAGPSTWWVAGFYMLVIPAMLAPAWLRQRRAAVATIGGWCTLGAIAPMFLASGSQPLTVTFLAVGHGCSAVLELPDGRTMLYDAGSMGSPEGAAQSIAGFLWSRGINRLDAIIISHADVDHYNAVPELLKRFRVKRIYLSHPMTAVAPDPPVLALRQAIAEARVPIELVAHGDTIADGRGGTIRVLHPEVVGLGATDNADSIVLAVESAGRVLLLPGDLESPGLERVTAQPPLDVDVLLAPHHGSVRSDPPGFARWSRPEIVVFSGGHGRDLTVTNDAYHDCGARTLHTARDGAVTIVLGEREITVSTFKNREEASE
jgi:competence protein ComEC